MSKYCNKKNERERMGKIKKRKRKKKKQFKKRRKEKKKRLIKIHKQQKKYLKIKLLSMNRVNILLKCLSTRNNFNN